MNPTQDICEVIITAPAAEWIEDFTTYLISEGLAACGHRQTIESTYTWQGALHSATETRVAIHTRIALFDRIASLAKERHPYDVPCVIALPITQASRDYAAWIRQSTIAESGSE